MLQAHCKARVLYPAPLGVADPVVLGDDGEIAAVIPEGWWHRRRGMVRIEGVFA